MNKDVELFILKLAFTPILMCLCFSFSLAQHENKSIRKGNQFYQDKKFSEAEKKYKEALSKNKESNEAQFNLGDALYEQKKYDQALEQFNVTAKNSNDKKLQAQAYHNLGNSYLQNKKYEESINAYKNALKMNPDDDDTRYNLAYAKSKLMQQQQQQQQKDNKDKKDNKDNKDQENKDKNNQKDQDKKDNKEQDNKDNEQKKQKEDEQKQAQQNPKMSKEDAERLLNALNNKEKDLHDKLKKKATQGVRVQIEKDW